MLQPPPAASRRSPFGQSPTSASASAPAPANVSYIGGTSPGPSLRNPPSPISFAAAARRPSFDLAAELLHSAADLRTATDGQRQVCCPTFPAALANALNGVLIQAKSLAVERESAEDSGAHTPTLSRSMAILACLRHSLPALSALAEPYLLARESLAALVSSNDIDHDLLDYVIDANESIPFTASVALCGPVKRVNLRLADDTEKHFSTAAYSLAVDRSQVVILVAAYTLSTQHHLLARRYLDLAADLISQYEIRATFAAKTTLAALEMVQADIAIHSKSSRGGSMGG